mmetsp:Transcript_33819/g.86685  ORF Transcript_33819/g.86685 Transcript_33819/m.86685 type:complete len:239 (+) Transcript_33819:177-893(+)
MTDPSHVQPAGRSAREPAGTAVAHRRQLEFGAGGAPGPHAPRIGGSGMRLSPTSGTTLASDVSIGTACSSLTSAGAASETSIGAASAGSSTGAGGLRRPSSALSAARTSETFSSTSVLCTRASVTASPACLAAAWAASCTALASVCASWAAPRAAAASCWRSCERSITAQAPRTSAVTCFSLFSPSASSAVTIVRLWVSRSSTSASVIWSKAPRSAGLRCRAPGTAAMSAFSAWISCR